MKASKMKVSKMKASKMKTLFITLLLSLTIPLTTVTNAALVMSSQGIILKKHKVEAVYQLEATRRNIRIYEFTPANNRNTLCILVFQAAKYKPMVMQCFKKDK